MVDNIKQLEERVAQIIIDELKLEDTTAQDFDPNMHLVDELGIDSMDLTVVVLVLQDEFSISIDEEQYGDLYSVHEIARYITAKQK